MTTFANNFKDVKEKFLKFKRENARNISEHSEIDIGFLLI